MISISINITSYKVTLDDLIPAFIQLLASQPSPEAILAIRPTPALQARMSELLERNKSGSLSRTEESELDRYLLLEHWVRLAKAHAYKQLQKSA